MGIFSYIQNKKKELRDIRTHSMKEQYEQDMIELKKLKAERKKLEEIKYLRDNVKSNKKQLRELKNPLLTKVVKNFKKNLKEKKNEPNNIWRQTQTSGFNPIFHTTSQPNNIFTSKVKKKKR